MKTTGLLWGILALFVGMTPTFVLAAEPADAENNTTSAPEQVVLARVGGDEITVQEFMNFISTHQNVANQVVAEGGTLSARQQALRTMIEQRLLLMAIKDQKLLPDKPELEQKDYMDAYWELASRHFPPAEISEPEARAYFEKNRTKYGIPRMVRLSQIHFRVPLNADKVRPELKKNQREKAEQALKRLAQGDSFAEVAREMTDNETARERGGDIGFWDPEKYPWMQSALAGLARGDHTGIVESPAGFEILRITEERPGILPTFEEVREEVVRDATLDRQEQAQHKYARALGDQFGVEIVMKEYADVWN